MILSADEVKVREEEKNKIVVRSDQAGPCWDVLNQSKRYQSGKQKHLDTVGVQAGRLVD